MSSDSKGRYTFAVGEDRKRKSKVFQVKHLQ